MHYLCALSSKTPKHSQYHSLSTLTAKQAMWIHEMITLISRAIQLSKQKNICKYNESYIKKCTNLVGQIIPDFPTYCTHYYNDNILFATFFEAKGST